MILRKVLGVVLLVHALYNVLEFDIYALQVDAYLRHAEMPNNTFLSWIVALFPFVEFALGALLLLKLFYTKTVLWTVVVFSITATLLFSFDNETLAGAALFVSCASLYIYLNKVDGNTFKKIDSHFPLL